MTIVQHHDKNGLLDIGLKGVLRRTTIDGCVRERKRGEMGDDPVTLGRLKVLGRPLANDDDDDEGLLDRDDRDVFKLPTNYISAYTTEKVPSLPQVVLSVPSMGQALRLSDAI